ncbi:hypothetical protein Ancab_015163, partial [Ancistrocladus abbreviatus]
MDRDRAPRLLVAESSTPSASRDGGKSLSSLVNSGRHASPTNLHDSGDGAASPSP